MDESAERRRRLVRDLRAQGHVRTAEVAQAFERVPREAFVPGRPLEEVYEDRAIVTRLEDGVPASSSSQPAIMARMLEMLQLRPGQRVLEAGAGSGYNAALLTELVAHDGEVLTLDLDPATASDARAHLRSAGYDRVRVRAADAAGGDPAGAPFDRIIATASCWSIPSAWVDQLAPGGLLVLPLRLNGVQAVFAFTRGGSSELLSVESSAGGFMPMRGSRGPFAASIGEDLRSLADRELDARELAFLRDAWDRPRPVELPNLESLETEVRWAFELFLGLQGAAWLHVLQPSRGRRPTGWSVLLASDASALRWAERPERGRPETLGDDDAAHFVHAALARWTGHGRPPAETLRVRVRATRGAAGRDALPRPFAGRYRFAREAFAYEAWYDESVGTAGR